MEAYNDIHRKSMKDGYAGLVDVANCSASRAPKHVSLPENPCDNGINGDYDDDNAVVRAKSALDKIMFKHHNIADLTQFMLPAVTGSVVGKQAIMLRNNTQTQAVTLMISPVLDPRVRTRSGRTRSLPRYAIMA